MNSALENDETGFGLGDAVGQVIRMALVLSRSWRTLVACSTIGIAAGLLVVLVSPVEFTSRSRLVPYKSGLSPLAGLSGLSSIAGMTGMRFPSSGAGDVVIAADIYPELVRTLDFRIAVAETPIRIGTSNGLQTAVNYFFQHDRILRGLPPSVSAKPHRPPEDFRASGHFPLSASPDTTVGPREISPYYRRAVDLVGQRIRVTHDNQTGIITVQAMMPDSLAAAYLVQAASDRLMETVLRYEVRKADEQLRFLDNQRAMARVRHDLAQRNLAQFADRNRSLVNAMAQVERTRLEREEQMAFEILQLIERETEQARTRRSQNVPVFSVLERAVVPTEPSKPRRVLVVLACFCAGALIGIVWVLRGDWVNRGHGTQRLSHG